MSKPFHAAIPVDDLDAARRFYGELLECAIGRSDTNWIDFDLYGNQLVCHRADRRGESDRTRGPANVVDGKTVPVPHFGVVLEMDEWQALADRLRAANVEFIVEPYIRFRGQAGEQGTLFITDPSGNVLEFKGFADLNRLFET
jgi:extradiol dioxygenase family protein